MRALSSKIIRVFEADINCSCILVYSTHMPEDLHEAHLKQQRDAFAKEIASYKNPPEVADEKNLFEVSNLSDSVLRRKVRMLSMPDTFRSSKVTGLKTNLFGAEAYQPNQQLEEFLERDEPEFEDSDRFTDSSDFTLSLKKNGDFQLSLPSINGERESSSGIMKMYDHLSVTLPFGADLGLSFGYDFRDTSNATLTGLSVSAETPWAQKKSGRSWGSSLGIKFDKDTKKAVLDRVNEFDFDEPKTVFEEGKEYELDRYGRKIRITVSGTSVKLVSSIPEREDSDMLVVVPRFQPLEKILDHNTEYVQRFTWEDDLVPEPLRRDPMQPYSETFDEAWIRADIPKLLGIKVQKNNPPPASKHNTPD